MVSSLTSCLVLPSSLCLISSAAAYIPCTQSAVMLTTDNVDMYETLRVAQMHLLIHAVAYTSSRLTRPNGQLYNRAGLPSKHYGLWTPLCNIQTDNSMMLCQEWLSQTLYNACNVRTFLNLVHTVQTKGCEL